MVFLDLSIFRKAFRFIGAVLCDVIYTLVSKVYELFMTVARLNILSSDQIQPIYQRITMILTIVMVFYVTFEFVKYTISPDTITDKEKGAGNILKRIIIVVVLIALTPEIFTTAYKLQNRIIETQLISKVILGTSNGNYTTYGNDFSANMLNLFYYYDEDVCSDGSGDCNDAKKAVVENLNHIRATGDAAITDGINLASTHNIFKEKSPAIKFNGVLAIVVGGVILYMLIMYSIDVGTRYAQLIFLQMISPIAIMGYILPKKDGIFQKWGKQCITTYIDLFLRIAIINFVLLITKVLGDSFQNGHIFEGIDGVSDGLKMFVYIVLVIGLLAFAQRAPKLLGELFPSSGAAGLGFGLGTKDRGLAPAGRIFGAAAGTAIGAGAGLATGIAQGRRRREAALAAGKTKGQARRAAIGGALWGGARGLAGGAARGMYNGGKKGNMFKNIGTGTKNQIDSNKKFGNRQENGYSFKEQLGDTARNALGMKSRVDKLEEEKAPRTRQKNQYDELSKKNDAIREYSLKKGLEKAVAGTVEYTTAVGELERLQKDTAYIQSLGGTTSQKYKDAVEDARKREKKYRDMVTNNYFDTRMATGEDGNLNNLVAERNQSLADYNRYANQGYQIAGDKTDTKHGGPKQVSVNIKDPATGNMITINKFIDDMSAEEFDEYIKQTAKKESSRLTREIGERTAEQEAIKRQTAGSGVAGEGKK